MSRRNRVAWLKPSGTSFSLEDSSTITISADSLVKVSGSRDPKSLAAGLAKQFVLINAGLLNTLGVSAVNYDSKIVIRSGVKIGAIPLLSPTSAQADYGIIVLPRFGWMGLGTVLAQTGWKVVPSLLAGLPMLPQSDRNIPPWVLSGAVLMRLQALLRRLQRNFILTEKDLQAPRGQVKWDRYAQNRLPRMKALNVPCQVPDLEDHREIKAAIHFALKKQLNSLQTQLPAGIVVAKLIELCNTLIAQVQSVHPKIPSARQLKSWSQIRLNRDVFQMGLDAIEWTIEDRGLAGVSDLRGLPWIMSMDKFYESWVETILEHLTRKIGGVLRVGRKRETITAIAWDKPFLGSQKSLWPDFIIDHPSGPIVVDAKYKEHWEDLQDSSWLQLEEQIRSGHRQDLLQILAYAALSDKPMTTACLIYPCREKTWESLRQRQRLSHRATIQTGSRRINLILATFPMSGTAERILAAIGPHFLHPANA